MVIMRRFVKLVGLFVMLAISGAQQRERDLDRLTREQERHDMRIERLEQQVATNTGYIAELKEANLRERLARLENANDLVIKLLVAIFTTLVATALYQIRRFTQLRTHLEQIRDMRLELTKVHHQVKNLACMDVQPNCIDPDEHGRAAAEGLKP